MRAMTELTPAEALLQVTQSPDLDPRSLHPEPAMKDGSGELYDQVRQRITEPGGLYFMCKGLLGFPDLERRAHYAVSLFYEDDSVRSKLVEFPKSHFKTSIGTIGKILHRFANRVIFGEDCWDRIAICSNTKTNAQRFLRLLRRIPENNALFQNFLPELLPEFSDEDVWNQNEIIFPRRGSYTDPSVDTLGIGGAATTRHYTTIIEDDMLAEEDADSETAIRKAIELHQYYTSLLVPGNDSTYHLLINEHSWTQFDLNKHVIDTEPETAVFSVGASRGLNEKRSRLIPPYILRYTEAWQDGDTVFPEKYGRAELQRRRDNAGARIYNAVYENDPFDPDVVDFKEEWLHYYTLRRDELGNRYLLISPDAKRGIDMEKVPLSSLYIVAAFDPALSKKTDAARSAFVVHGVDPQNRVFQLETYAYRRDPFVVLNDIFKLILKWNVQRCGVEEVLFQKVLLDLLEQHARKWNTKHELNEKVFPGIFEGVKPPRGLIKDARIRALIGTSFEEGRVYINPDQTFFVDEYLHFPMGATKDLLDAFAYASQLWRPGESEEDIHAYLRMEEEFRSLRDAITGY